MMNYRIYKKNGVNDNNAIKLSRLHHVTRIIRPRIFRTHLSEQVRYAMKRKLWKRVFNSLVLNYCNTNKHKILKEESRKNVFGFMKKFRVDCRLWYGSCVFKKKTLVYFYCYLFSTNFSRNVIGTNIPEFNRNWYGDVWLAGIFDMCALADRRVLLGGSATTAGIVRFPGPIVHKRTGQKTSQTGP